MSKTVWSLVACALWLASCDGSIGREQCIGTACSKPLGLQPTLLDVTFQKVSAKDPADLPIKWRIPRASSAASMPPPPIALVRAAGDAVWTPPRDAAPQTIDRVDAAGIVSQMSIPPPLAKSPGAPAAFLSADLMGRALVHLQWTGPSMEPVDQLAFVQPGGPIQGVMLSSAAALPAPLALIAAPAGFLLFQGDERGQVVRLVDPTGTTSWQQTQFPKFARYLGTSAVFSGDRFVLSASDGEPKDIHYGVLSLDAHGAVTKFEINSDSRWTSSLMLQLDERAYAVAAGSDLFTQNFVGDGVGNLDVVVFGADGKLTGYRIERECALNLSVFGFTADAAGNLYVSSVAGTKAAPRGLLCRLSATVPSGCFQTEPQLLLGQIAATDAGVIFAAAGDEILRIELPPGR